RSSAEAGAAVQWLLAPRLGAALLGQDHTGRNGHPAADRPGGDLRAMGGHARSDEGFDHRAAQGIRLYGPHTGTDETGRDLFSRLVYGARLTLLAGVLPVVFALVIGGFLGITAGYFRGWVNTLIMRGMDVLYAFPSILLAIAITGILGAGLFNTILALTITFIPPIVRISETITTQVRA